MLVSVNITAHQENQTRIPNCRITVPHKYTQQLSDVGMRARARGSCRILQDKRLTTIYIYNTFQQSEDCNSFFFFKAVNENIYPGHKIQLGKYIQSAE